jgi:hypothetical protein
MLVQSSVVIINSSYLALETNNSTYKPNTIVLCVVRLQLNEVTKSPVVHPRRDHGDAAVVGKKPLVKAKEWQNMRMLQLTPDNGLLVQHLGTQREQTLQQQKR